MAEILLVDRPSIKIEIRGQGSQANELHEETRKRKLLNVEFRSLVPTNELNRALSEADIYLVPQISSGSGFAIPAILARNGAQTAKADGSVTYCGLGRALSFGARDRGRTR